tara:strand:+ start:9687 stop:10160 length:474 start_codon:yes stop_codon:yes gene_type:complete
MKELIHRVVTDIKFLYPCLAHGEINENGDLLVETETKLSKVYPIVKTVKGMKSIGEDYWGRETFINDKEQYYCEVDGELYFKGNDPEGEPGYPVKEEINYSFPDIDNELIEFKPFIDKVKDYLAKEGLILVETNTSLKLNSKNTLCSKIICAYTIKL